MRGDFAGCCADLWHILPKSRDNSGEILRYSLDFDAKVGEKLGFLLEFYVKVG